MTHDTQRRHLFFICVTNYSEINAKVYIIKVLIIYNVNAVPSFPFVCSDHMFRGSGIWCPWPQHLQWGDKWWTQINHQHTDKHACIHTHTHTVSVQLLKLVVSPQRQQCATEDPSQQLLSVETVLIESVPLPLQNVNVCQLSASAYDTVSKPLGFKCFLCNNCASLKCLCYSVVNFHVKVEACVSMCVQQMDRTAHRIPAKACKRGPDIHLIVRPLFPLWTSPRTSAL